MQRCSTACIMTVQEPHSVFQKYADNGGTLVVPSRFVQGDIEFSAFRFIRPHPGTGRDQRFHHGGIAAVSSCHHQRLARVCASSLKQLGIDQAWRNRFHGRSGPKCLRSIAFPIAATACENVRADYAGHCDAQRQRQHPQKETKWRANRGVRRLILRCLRFSRRLMPCDPVHIIDHKPRFIIAPGGYVAASLDARMIDGVHFTRYGHITCRGVGSA